VRAPQLLGLLLGPLLGLLLLLPLVAARLQELLPLVAGAARGTAAGPGGHQEAPGQAAA
jgi:hypothetical protein